MNTFTFKERLESYILEKEHKVVELPTIQTISLDTLIKHSNKNYLDLLFIIETCPLPSRVIKDPYFIEIYSSIAHRSFTSSTCKGSQHTIGRA